MKIPLLIFASTAALLAFDQSNHSEAAPRKAVAAKPAMTILKFPSAQLKSFALSKTAASYDPNDRASGVDIESGDALPPRAIKVEDGSAILYSASAQTTFRFPLGWRGSDDGRQTVMFTPDQSVRLILAMRDIGDGAPNPQNAFWRFRANAPKVFAGQLKGQRGETIRQFALEPIFGKGSFAMRISGITTESGRKNEFLQVFTPAPNGGQFALSLSLTAPANRFAAYLPLVGLMLRDAKTVWSNGSENFAGDLQISEEAKPFEEAARRAMKLLAANDEAGLLKMMSRETMEEAGEATMRAQFQDAVKNFFKDFADTGSVSITPYNSNGKRVGFLFFFDVRAKDGREDRFSVLIKREDDLLVVNDFRMESDARTLR